MKVLDLQCAHLHSFEGWFGSEAEFQSQLATGLVSCPMCNSTQVLKKLSAPRLNLSGATAPVEHSRQHPGPAPVTSAHGGQLVPVDIHSAADDGGAPSALSNGIAGNPELQAVFVRAVREILRQTEDVGNQFADQARRMHHGEQETKAIRGQATRAETMALLDEGIDVMPLPDLPGLKGTLQ